MDSAMARANRSGDDSEIADGLTRREHDILAFERQWWKYAGVKEDSIKELFSMSATRYYQVLNARVDRPEALAADPMLVKRLRRVRARRQKARGGGRPRFWGALRARGLAASGTFLATVGSDERARSRLHGASPAGHGDGAVVPGRHFSVARLAGAGVFRGLRRRFGVAGLQRHQHHRLVSHLEQR